jgi:hypothetical protein
MRHEFLHSKLREVAEKIAHDYPGISDASAWEQLYAISTAHEGCLLAIQDLHYAIKKLGEKLNMSNEDLVDFLLQAYKERDQATDAIPIDNENS